VTALMSVARMAFVDTYTPIDFPGAVATDLGAINESGVMVGTYTDGTGASHGFKFDGDTFAAFGYPGATIGANGTLVGEFKTGQVFGQLGFAWILRDGQYMQLTPPDCSGAPPPHPVQAFALQPATSGRESDEKMRNAPDCRGVSSRANYDVRVTRLRGSSAAFPTATDAATCAAPSPRSGGCARASRRTACQLLRACGRYSSRCRSASAAPSPHAA